MPEITMEILCFAILFLLGFLAAQNKTGRKDRPLYTVYVRLFGIGLINILCETLASIMTANREHFSPITAIIIMEGFIISLAVLAYFAYLFVRELINSDIPELKKIGKWANYPPLFILGVIVLIPIFSVRIIGTRITFGKQIYLCYVLQACFELYILALLVINRKYINSKRKKILALAFVIQFAGLVAQGFNPHILVTGMGVTIMIISFYMILEDSDVRLIEQLSQEKENADKTNIRKSEFIANVSHEIRTPINAVLGMNEMILRETHENTTRQYSLDIKSAAETLHGIIDEILDMSRMETGSMEIVSVNYSLRDLIRSTINIIELKVKDKKLSFRLDVEEDIPSGYYGDEIRIRQVLSNILSNAVKYTESGFISMKISGERIDSNEENLFVEISDSGIGMKPEDVAAMFEEYTRFDITKNRNVEGTGLGMTITMQLLEMMGSKLEVSSVYGEGSTFKFALKQTIWDESPLGDIRKNMLNRQGSYLHENTFEAPSTRILMVDDNAINRKVFKGLLKDTKLQIDEAPSGQVCLDMVKKNRYRLIFMDHLMPDMDGIETFHLLKNMPDNESRDAKVIMLTANAVMGAREMYLDEGFDDFMAMPIVPSALEELIKKYIKDIVS